ncbi:MAG: T9SS type A sorting domain-containing protein [Bacteroidales bacterium]
MKKLFLSFIVGVIIQPLSYGQYQMTGEQHMLRAGDEHHFRIAQKADPGTDGTHQVWDFSHLVAEQDLHSHMLPYNNGLETPQIKGSVVLEEFGTHFIFDLSGTQMLQTATQLKGGGLIVYEKPLLRLQYPLTYGTYNQGEYAGYLLKGERKQSFFGHYEVHADASGTLILPGNVQIDNTIRIKSTKIQTYQSSSMASEVTSYKWYARGCRYPLLTIIQAGCGDEPKTIRTAFYANAADLLREPQELTNQDAFYGTLLSGYPNPAHEEVILEYSVNREGPVTFNIYSTQGSKVAQLKEGKKAPGRYEKRIDIKELNLPSGILILTLKTADRQQEYSLQVIH